MNTLGVSGFFEDLNCTLDLEEDLLILNESQSGFFRLYKRQKGGKYSVLKALKPQFKGQVPYEEMLRKEYEIGSRLNHPNIRQYLAYFEHPALGAVNIEYEKCCIGRGLAAISPIEGKAE